MDFGLILPSYRAGASVEGIEAAAETCARLGWHSVFTTDHLLVEPSPRSEDYSHLFDALLTTVHVAARQPRETEQPVQARGGKPLAPAALPVLHDRALDILVWCDERAGAVHRSPGSGVRLAWDGGCDGCRPRRQRDPDRGDRALTFEDYRPSNVGFLFSANARGPSTVSSERSIRWVSV